MQTKWIYFCYMKNLIWNFIMSFIAYLMLFRGQTIEDQMRKGYAHAMFIKLLNMSGNKLLKSS